MLSFTVCGVARNAVELQVSLRVSDVGEQIYAWFRDISKRPQEVVGLFGSSVCLVDLAGAGLGLLLSNPGNNITTIVLR